MGRARPGRLGHSRGKGADPGIGSRRQVRDWPQGWQAEAGQLRGFVEGWEVADAEVDEEAGEALDFLEGEDFVLGQNGVASAEDLGGHAVGAAEVAAIGDGNAQVSQFASEGVGDGWQECGRSHFGGICVAAAKLSLSVLSVVVSG